MDDTVYMQMALDVAQVALGRTSPNPAVGAILVKDHRVIGFGAHLVAGGPHAEVHALSMAGSQAQGSTLFVTLEPCSHYGRTPPCADQVIAAGVTRVVVARLDPFPLVSGRGVERLRQAGIDVEVGCLESAATRLNAPFLHFAQTGLPYVIWKTAATLDGFVATDNGDSRYVTGEESRAHVHRLRDQVDAIVVGVGTVIQDDPQLTVRLPTGGRNPVRVVFDTHLRTPLSARVVKDTAARTVILCGPEADAEREQALRQSGVEVWRIPISDCGGQVSLPDALKRLAQADLIYILLEGGSSLATSFMQAHAIQRIWYFLAPKLLGAGIPALRSFGFQKMRDAIVLSDLEVKTIGSDVLVMGSPWG